jgi:hypothetical protein
LCFANDTRPNDPVPRTRPTSNLSSAHASGGSFGVFVAAAAAHSCVFPPRLSLDARWWGAAGANGGGLASWRASSASRGGVFGGGLELAFFCSAGGRGGGRASGSGQHFETKRPSVERSGAEAVVRFPRDDRDARHGRDRTLPAAPPRDFPGANEDVFAGGNSALNILSPSLIIDSRRVVLEAREERRSRRALATIHERGRPDERTQIRRRARARLAADDRDDRDGAPVRGGATAGGVATATDGRFSRVRREEESRARRARGVR